MKRRFSRTHLLAAVFVAIFLAVIVLVFAHTSTPLSQLFPGSISVTFVDKESDQPIANTSLHVYIPTGQIQCIRAPCPIRDISKLKPWSGKTDGHGRVSIPSDIVIQSTTFVIEDGSKYPRYAFVRRQTGATKYTVKVTK